ncbi:hypothetical protein [Aquaticitalea lipolytica]|uniref:hypothetical protein n=1 Tax=Aquaticitalea lipolytica TaxID=1247562 RepID=UPI0024BAA58C|nr:hypothetical protein [Aquaticitalea lipolytica]
MKKFRIQKISKQDVYVRYLIAAVLILVVLKGELVGFPFYFLLILAGLLLFTGIVKRVFLNQGFAQMNSHYI